VKDGAAVRAVVYGGLAATVCISIGSLWDTLTHITRGHWLLAPAHLVIMAATALFTLCGGAALGVMRRADARTRRALRVVVAGSVLVVVSLTVLDELWHLWFGLDTTGWSPPHLLFWLGMLTELFGLLLLSRPSLPAGARQASWWGRRGERFLICAAILVILLFILLEYDVPASAGIADERPPFTYPVVGTFLWVIGLLVVRAALRPPWAATRAAALAWLFFGGTGVLIEQVSGVSYVVLPFPMVIPALALDGWMAVGWHRPASRRGTGFLAAALVVGTIGYWSMIGWAACIMALPHQLSGTPVDWLQWFILLNLPLSCAAGYSAWQLAQRYLPEGTP
jgi:hypothetical protein